MEAILDFSAEAVRQHLAGWIEDIEDEDRWPDSVLAEVGQEALEGDVIYNAFHAALVLGIEGRDPETLAAIVEAEADLAAGLVTPWKEV